MFSSVLTFAFNFIFHIIHHLPYYNLSLAHAFRHTSLFELSRSPLAHSQQMPVLQVNNFWKSFAVLFFVFLVYSIITYTSGETFFALLGYFLLHVFYQLKYLQCPVDLGYGSIECIVQKIIPQTSRLWMSSVRLISFPQQDTNYECNQFLYINITQLLQQINNSDPLHFNNCWKINYQGQYGAVWSTLRF